MAHSSGIKDTIKVLTEKGKKSGIVTAIQFLSKIVESLNWDTQYNEERIEELERQVERLEQAAKRGDKDK